MGIYLYLHRLPLDSAVDTLTQRRDYDYVEEHCLKPFEEWHNPLRGSPPEHPPRTLDFQRSYHRVRDAMVGGALTYEDRFEEMGREPPDPRFWAIHGARLVGYECGDFPWRYSLPTDIEAICETLKGMTEADLRENAEYAIEEDRQYEGTTDRTYDGESAQKFMREELPKRLLPALRQFYRAARTEKQIVVRWMG